MYYFVCEGQEGKSEYQFISTVIDMYNTNLNEYELLPCNGNINIKKVLNSVLEKCIENDRVILFFDNIEKIGNTFVYDLLCKYIKLFTERGVIFRYSTYYCYEELFLSYIKFPLLIRPKFSEIAKLIQSSLYDGYNYLDRLSDTDLSLIYDLTSSNYESTREQISAALLGIFSKQILGKFWISKKEFQECWIHDCNSINIDKNMCKRCLLNITKGLDKVEDLDKNSVSRFSAPLSTIFD